MASQAIAQDVLWMLDLRIPCFNHKPTQRTLRRRANSPIQPQPNCPFLSILPSEVRLHIYSHIATNDLHTRRVAMKGNIIWAPPFGRVCKLIEKEYSHYFVKRVLHSDEAIMCRLTGLSHTRRHYLRELLYTPEHGPEEWHILPERIDIVASPSRLAALLALAEPSLAAII